MQQYFDTNKSLWDKKTPVHLKSELYDLANFKAGKTSLNKIELDLLGDVQDKKILHVQCHFGQDSLSLARLGAEVTGVDFSTEAIKTARQLNTELGLNATFVECNIYDLEAHLEGEFDAIFVSYGALPWLPDIHEWMRITTHFLKKGGLFYLVEFHPFLYVLDWEKYQISYDYFHQKEPYMEIMQGTYADPSADLEHKEYFWNYAIQDVMQAFLKRGLQLHDFQEYNYSPYNVFGKMTKHAERQYTIGDFPYQLPHVYSMVWEVS